jgi:molybdopterin converting factor small subunit
MSEQTGGSVTVRVLLFGALRDHLGTAELRVQTAPMIGAVWDAVTAGHPDVVRDGVRAARNLRFCEWNSVVADGDEIAFMPPVSGG